MPVQLIPIEAHERTVGQIFDDAYAFEIPAYQRPYAWEIDQVRELLSDLLEAMEDKPVLQRLDEALSTGGASYDELVSIEHVLPQTVDEGSEWEMLFPDESQRTAWTHRLANLVFLTHRVNTRASNWDFGRKKTEYFSSDDGSSPFVITQEVLRTEHWTPEYLIVRQQKLLTKLANVWNLDISKIQGEDSDAAYLQPTGTKDVTEPGLIEAKRQKAMCALGEREGAKMIQKIGALFADSDDNIRAVYTFSKRYPKGSPYWYGYSPQWDAFLAGGKVSYFVLGSADRDGAFAVPHEVIHKLLKHLRRTPERHWHVALEENAAGQIDLVIPKTGSRIGLAEFEIGAS